TLSWTSADPELRCMVQYRFEGGSSWRSASGWLGRGLYTLVHARLMEPRLYYRLRVRDAGGKMNREHVELAV
ncbi:MAG: hypothetical protein R3B70_42900, partial [Polyangiaceae bacterium]